MIDYKMLVYACRDVACAYNVENHMYVEPSEYP
jgi:hypothetical protein